ncbi:hypothetical protein O3M35_006529 [Rhynocoris fuscipes]|uniref:Otopetrin-2 n=1 Tax=Rhynocoris fuscipes TaxID=488301 RepID=A0AAW1DGJ2_9HEMI
MSFIYAKLLVVICLAYVVSEVVTHSLPLVYYEGFFTYLYGTSILFLLYVFCFLLQESTCCQGSSSNPSGSQLAVEAKPTKQKKENKKEKENKKNQKKENKEKKEREKKEKKKSDSAASGKGGEGGKEKEKEQQQPTPAPPPLPPPVQQQTVQRNSRSNIFQGLGTLKKSKSGSGDAQSQEKLSSCGGVGGGGGTDIGELESGMVQVVSPARKRKTSQNTSSHGSFFLRVGAIAFGLATMIYNGLEFGAFFEIPFNSPCYQILRGVNPVLQMIFTFMQMYFIFMNSRLNIHRFKVIARFGLMHIVATNLCVWIRTLVLESLKEISGYLQKNNMTLLTGGPSNATSPLLTNQPLHLSPPYSDSGSFNFIGRPAAVAPASHGLWDEVGPRWDEIGDSPLAPAALVDQRSLSSDNCDRINIMGTIVQDSAPYLFPFIIEYSLIGAAVIYVMWRHIGKNPRYFGEEDLEHKLEVILSRRAVAMAHAQQGARMDCVGASKGLFLGLLLLVGSLICLILFFVLIHNEKLNLLAIYLADVSHCVLMVLSIIAIIIGFIRVQGLKFRGDEQSDLNDILLRVSAFGLFIYAVFSVIAGSLTALVSEPNLLVMVTGILAIFQVVLQLLFISDVSRRRVHLPEHDRSKPGRQVVTFLLIANVTMWIIYTFETQKVVANPVQLDFYGFLAWSMVQRVTLPLCIFHRFHSAVTLAEIWKTSYKPRID